MKTEHFISSIFLSGALLILASCSQKWHTSFEDAAKSAQKKDQDIFLLVSGDSWDGHSKEFKEEVLSGNDFKNGLAKNYTLLNIDTEGSEKDISNILPLNVNIKQYPSIFIISREGWLLSEVPQCQDIKEYYDLKTRFTIIQNNLQKLTDLAKDIRKKQGLDRVRAINAFWDEQSPEGKKTTKELIQEVLQIDSSNETGLLGKFQLLNAYEKAEGDIKNGDIKSACGHFEQICSDQNLSPEQKQEAYYSQALIIISSFASGNYKLEDFDKVHELLTKACQASPSGIHTSDIERIKKYVEEARIAAQEH